MLAARRACLALLVCLVSWSGVVHADVSLYQQARALEALGDFEGALARYDAFLKTTQAGDDVLQARVKMPVLREAIDLGADASVQLYLDALDARYQSDTGDALLALAQLRAAFPDSHLADDALYLSGYILLMDRFDYAAARQHMVELRRAHPDSSYLDASMYVEAIALEQAGDTDAARLMFQQLRDRHALIAIDRLNLVLPRTSLQSRLWFDRAASRLANLDQHALEATRIVEQGYLDTGHYERRVVLRVAGRDVPLLLNPSRVFRSTRFVDEFDRPIDLGNLRAFDGVIEGRPHSWARVVFNGSDVQGLIRDGDARYDLKTDTATGTLVDYNTRLADSDKIATHTGGAQPVEAPHATPDANPRRAPASDLGVSKYVNRVVRMSVVIDSQYNDYTNNSGLFEAMTVTSIADGIYRDELGLALQAESVVLVTDRDRDPMRIGNASMDDILNNFRAFRLTSRAIASESSLVYLLSGNRSNDNQVGLAFIDVACRSDGYDVSAATPYRQNFLLAAHEMAHNLGAEHDTDTQCASDASKIMSPYFSSDTQQEFSSCSKVSINHSLQGSCHAPAVDLQATIGHASDSRLTAWVSNNDPTRPASAALSVSVPDTTVAALPEGCTQSTNGDVVCDLASLAAGDTRRLDFALQYVGDPASDRRVGLNVQPTVVEDALLHNNAALLKRSAGSEYSNTGPVASAPSAGGGGSLSPIDIALLLVLPPAVWLRWRS
ncbi:MAG: reprolysin-like metallopeptidase [Pseudomonadota bacterium]